MHVVVSCGLSSMLTQANPDPLKTDVYSALFVGECVRLLAHVCVCVCECVCVCVCVLSARIQLGIQHNRESQRRFIQG